MKIRNLQNLKKGIIFVFTWILSFALFAQNITVKGSVTNTNNEPIIGATVRNLENVTNGTVTDIDGNYTLNNVAPNTTLEVSYVGMITQAINVDGRNIINILMNEDTELLKEVVVIGYGTMKKVI